MRIICRIFFVYFEETQLSFYAHRATCWRGIKLGLVVSIRKDLIDLETGRRFIGVLDQASD